MKKTLIIFSAIIIIFSGCSSYFDDQNIVGSEFAKEKSIQRESIPGSVTLTQGTGLDTAYSEIFAGLWGKTGPCRLGSFRTIPFYAYLEFGAKSIKDDFYKFYSNSFDTLNKFRGIDSISILIHFETNSSLSHISYKPSVILCRTSKDSAIISNQTVYFIKSFTQFKDTLKIDSLIGSSDLGTANIFGKITLSDTSSSIFRYLDSILLSKKRDSSYITAIPLLLKMSDNTKDSILTIDVNHPPEITFYGYTIPVYTAYLNDTLVTWNDNPKRDSINTFVRYLNYYASPVDSGTTRKFPTLSTIYYHNPDDTLNYTGYPAGLYRAVFKVDRDSLFKSLNHDSVNILSAIARFYTNRNESFSENMEGLNISLVCRFYDANGVIIAPKYSVLSVTDTTIANYVPEQDSIINFPIDKFMAALTDPLYSEARTIVFLIGPDLSRYSNLSRMSRVVFKKEVKIDFAYSRR